MCQRDIFAVEALDVAHHFRFRMIFVEYLVRQVGTLALQLIADNAALRYIAHFRPVLSGGDGEDRYQYVGGCHVCGFVNAHSYIAVLEVT